MDDLKKFVNLTSRIRNLLCLSASLAFLVIVDSQSFGKHSHQRSVARQIDCAVFFIQFAVFVRLFYSDIKAYQSFSGTGHAGYETDAFLAIVLTTFNHVENTIDSSVGRNLISLVTSNIFNRVIFIESTRSLDDCRRRRIRSDKPIRAPFLRVIVGRAHLEHLRNHPLEQILAGNQRVENCIVVDRRLHNDSRTIILCGHQNRSNRSVFAVEMEVFQIERIIEHLLNIGLQGIALPDFKLQAKHYTS